MIAPPVKEFAIEHNLKVYQPEKVKGNEEFLQEIKDMNPDLICVVAYGKILPKEILDIPHMDVLMCMAHYFQNIEVQHQSNGLY